MALFAYRQQVQRLLNDVAVARFNPTDLDIYINSARGQLAGEAECVRVYATLPTAAGQRQYPFSSIAFPVGTQGVQGVINVRMMTYSVPGSEGQAMVTPREWEFFNTYVLATMPLVDGSGNPIGGAPEMWAQFGQGANGTLFINRPDIIYTLNLDTVCYPVQLTTDATPEAVPYLWTDAIPYYAAYLALLAVQEDEKAAGMLKLYQGFAARARQIATPSVLPHQYEQAPDPMMQSRLGLVKAVA